MSPEPQKIGRTTLDLGECLGRGGEATIFALKSSPGTIAKLYHHPTTERAEKLAVMIDHPPSPLTVHGHTMIAWPTERLFTPPGTGRFTGCLMPRVAAGVRAAMLHNMKSRLVANPHFTWKYLVRAAMNLALTFQKVHEGGYVIGDVNDQGVLVADNALVSLVDCDSFQVTDPQTGRVFRCPVGMSLYTPPELVGCRFSEIDRVQNHDLFGLAVIVYQFLMGCHPFQVKVADADDAMAIEDAIVRGLYPDLAGVSAQSPVAPPIEILPASTRSLFRLAFAGDTPPRPASAAWAHELWQIEQGLRSCGRNVNHAFADHLGACPWCERTAHLGGRDPFPSPDAIRAGEHLRRYSAPQFSWDSPRPRAHTDRRLRWRQAFQRSGARVWRPRGR